MSETPSSTSIPVAEHSAPSTPKPRLTRTRSPRVVAGVCGGVARYLDVDPVLLRVILAVVVVFGGVTGIPVLPGLAMLAYVAGWLALPDEGDENSAIEALFGRGRSSLSRNWTIVLLIVAAITLGNLGNGGAGSGAVILIVAIAAYAVLRGRNRSAPTPPAAVTPAPTPPFAPHGPYESPTHSPAAANPVVPPPAPPRRKRERSVLGRYALSAMLLAIGTLVVISASGFRVPASVYFATALAVCAAGLLVGSFAGRARGLIPLGIILAAGLAISTSAGTLHVGPHAGAGDIRWTPTTFAPLQDHYEHGVGNATLDLTHVPLTGDTSVSVDQGIGNVVVILPSGLDTSVNAHLGAGRMALFGAEKSGPGLTNDVTDYGGDGPGGPLLHLTISAGAGNVEVRREAA